MNKFLDIINTIGNDLPLSTMNNSPKAHLHKKYPNEEEMVRIKRTDEPSPNHYFQTAPLSSIGKQTLSTKKSSPSYHTSNITNKDRRKVYNPGFTEKDNELTESPAITTYNPERVLFDDNNKGESKIYPKAPVYSLRDPYDPYKPPNFPGPGAYEPIDHSSSPVFYFYILEVTKI